MLPVATSFTLLPPAASKYLCKLVCEVLVELMFLILQIFKKAGSIHMHTCAIKLTDNNYNQIAY